MSVEFFNIEAFSKIKRIILKLKVIDKNSLFTLREIRVHSNNNSKTIQNTPHSIDSNQRENSKQREKNNVSISFKMQIEGIVEAFSKVRRLI